MVAALVVGVWNGVLWGEAWVRILHPPDQRDVTGRIDFREPPSQWEVGPAEVWIAGEPVVFSEELATSRGLLLDPGEWVRVRVGTGADQVDVALFSDPPRARWQVVVGDGMNRARAMKTQRGVGTERRYRLEPEQPGLWFAVTWDGSDAQSLWQVTWDFAHRAENRLPPVAGILAAMILTFGIFRWTCEAPKDTGRGRDEAANEPALRLSDKETNSPTVSTAAETRDSRTAPPWVRWVGRVLAVGIGVEGSAWMWMSGSPAEWVMVAAAAVWLGVQAWRWIRNGEPLAVLPRPDTEGPSRNRTEPDKVLARRGVADLRLGSRAGLAVMAAILLLGLHVRWLAYEEHRREPLQPDAVGFLEIVRSGAWYATAASQGPWVREPLWIWVNRAAGWVLGMRETTLRLVSLVAGLLVVLQAARLGTRWFGVGVGLAGAAGLALSPHWAVWTAQGLRTDFYTLVVVTFALEWDRSRGRRGGGAAEAGVLGGIAAAAHLTYISALAWTIPLLIWRFAWDRWRLRWAGLALAVAVVPLLPHLAFNYRFRDSKDFFFSSNVHAIFYRNYERYGLPGSPDREKFLEAPYGGPPVTTMGYLLGEHSMGELVGGMIRGAWNIYVYRAAGIEQFGASKIATAFYAFGVLVALGSAAGRRSLAVWAWMGLPFLFLASLPGFSLRLVAPLTPWMWFYLALGLGWVVVFLRSRAGKKVPDPRGKVMVGNDS